MKKRWLLALVAVMVAVFAVGCASNDTTPTATATPAATVEAATTEAVATAEATTESTVEATAAAETGSLELTLEELAAYDGKNGNPAYVAVNGVIYDVTNARGWDNGMHEGYAAGQDLTDATESSPHGDSVLKDLPVIGTLKASS